MPNKTVPFIHVPAHALAAKTPASALCSLISMAFSEKLRPKFTDLTGVERKSIFVPPVLDARIGEMAEKCGRSYSDSFAALCSASLEVLMQQRKSMAQTVQTVQVPFQSRPGQDLYYKSIAASLSKNRICLAEASTGIGKSRAMVAAAITTAMEQKTPVVVAAPTLAILGGSLWKELESLQRSGLGLSSKARFFPGASEFIDRDRLVKYLEEAQWLDEPEDKKVREWVANGCPCLHKTPLIDAMTRSGQTLKCLMSDLRELATELDPSEFAFKKMDQGNDDIRVMLDAIRKDAVSADIILCTHAMLAIAKMTAWTWFPKPAVLFIDEAHLFEGIVAGATSTHLSLYSLRHNVRVIRKSKGLGTTSVMGKLQASVSDLIHACREVDQGYLGFRMNPKCYEFPNFVAALRKTEVLLKSRTLAEIPKIEDARTCMKTALQAIDSGVNAFGRIEFSPDRRFPSFLVGSRSVSGFMGGLWSDASGGAVLASATLSTPDEFGNSKFDYVSQLLALPLSRLDTPNPVVAPWVTSIPVIHVPVAPELVARPLRALRTDELELGWLEMLSEQVLCVSELARGGTLVLMTSYAQINAMADLLRATTGFGMESRVILQNPDEKFQACEARFRASHALGIRPILLGLGVAWTGVDLVDKTVAPEDDKLMTDLVIGCLPVGLNRSSTMAARVDSQQLNPIIKETLMMLLQGMGRSIRSEGAMNKNIWIMDGRLWTDWPGMQPLQKSARRIVERYSKKEKF